MKTHLFVPETEENSEKEQSKLQLRLKRNRTDLVEELRQSLREAIKVEKIKIEWKFPFKGGGVITSVVFHPKNDKLFNPSSRNAKVKVRNGNFHSFFNFSILMASLSEDSPTHRTLLTLLCGLKNDILETGDTGPDTLHPDILLHVTSDDIFNTRDTIFDEIERTQKTEENI